MIRQIEMPCWLTTKQNISISKGQLVDALIINAIFRANAENPIGDIDEEDMVKKINMVKNHIKINQETLKKEINKQVMEEFYG